MPDNEDLFRFQFSSDEAFLNSQRERGSVEEVDFDIRGLHTRRKVSLFGVPAILNKIIMYFASAQGDYLRSSRGNEFAFIYNAPVNTATQFRILSTATAIMRREFPRVRVEDIQVRPDTQDQRKGWDLRMVIRHQSLEESVGLEIPLGDEDRLPSPRDFIRI